MFIRNNIIAKSVILLIIITTLFTTSGCDSDADFPPSAIFPPSPTGSRIAVANRGAQTVSLIDVNSEDVVDLVLPEGSEPMYAQNPLYSNEIWIGDRGRNKLMVFDALRLRLKQEIDVGKGVFHMWSHPAIEQMWVVNDIDKTISVVSLESKQVVATIPVPSDLVADFKPHDMTTTSSDGIVSLLGNNEGWLVKFSGETFKEVGRLKVPADPHMMHWGLENSHLYVASQAGKLLRVDPKTLTVTGELDIPGAHGIWGNEEQTHLYVTNIESAGNAAIYTIDIATFTIIPGSPVATPLPFPHNVMVSIDNSKLFISHSKDSEQVSIFDIDTDGLPINGRTVRTGKTPFGIMLIRDPQELEGIF